MRILITGGSTGIGAACARRAVEAGHEVVLAARSADKLDALAEEDPVAWRASPLLRDLAASGGTLAGWRR